MDMLKAPVHACRKSAGGSVLNDFLMTDWYYYI
jgi:hypothetical protein